jgi:signal transduction histidine kinase
MVNPETGLLEIEASVGLDARAKNLKLRLGQGITGWVALHGESVCVGDVRKDDRYISVRKGIRSELAVPLMRKSLNEGNQWEERESPIGVLNVDGQQKNAFQEADLELLQVLGQQVSSLVQSVWLHQQVQRRADRLDRLLQVGQKMMAAQSLPEVLEQTVQGASKVTGSEYAEVFSLDRSGENLQWAGSSRPQYHRHLKWLLPVDDSLMGNAVRLKKPFPVRDIHKFEPPPFIRSSYARKLTSLLIAPLIVGDRVLGTLQAYSTRPRLYSKDEIQILSALAHQSALAMQRSYLTEKLATSEEQIRTSERLSAIGLLSAEVAHEIRNPLTVMKMLTHSLKREISKQDPHHRDFEVLERKMDQMNHTVERVLGLARNSDPSFEPCRIENLLEELLLLTRHNLVQHAVHAELKISPGLPLLPIDRAQIEQALLNLILNALHSMPKGGRLRISSGLEKVKTSKSTSRIWIEVRDTGKGMTEHELQNLFRPFLTSKKGGTGIGMAIVRKIVQAHEGELQIRSHLKKGTSVRILLPQNLGLSGTGGSET